MAWVPRSYLDDLASGDVLGAEPDPMPDPEMPDAPIRRPWLLEGRTGGFFRPRCCHRWTPGDEIYRMTGPVLAPLRPNGRAFYACSSCLERLILTGRVTRNAMLRALGANAATANAITNKLAAGSAPIAL